MLYINFMEIMAFRKRAPVIYIFRISSVGKNTKK